jgi:hypothetical protein
MESVWALVKGTLDHFYKDDRHILITDPRDLAHRYATSGQDQSWEDSEEIAHTADLLIISMNVFTVSDRISDIITNFMEKRILYDKDTWFLKHMDNGDFNRRFNSQTKQLLNTLEKIAVRDFLHTAAGPRTFETNLTSSPAAPTSIITTPQGPNPMDGRRQLDTLRETPATASEQTQDSCETDRVTRVSKPRQNYKPKKR